MIKINIASKEVIHFIGIGGIGMSGLAQIMKNTGFKVQGSDINNNKNIERLKKIGIKIFIGHSKKNISGVTLVVISSAIKKNNPELVALRKKKIPIFFRGDMLANIVSLKKNIVISGSHGKTTTTSLVSNILLESKLDPTVINGGIINSLKNTAKLGKGDWAVIESDESDGSFLKLPITYSIVTNIDKEHLDYYKNFSILKKSFQKFIEKTPSFGKSFVCYDDKNINDIIKLCKSKNFLTYGFNKKSNFRIINVKKSLAYSKFDLKINIYGQKEVLIKNINLKLLGDHNILNATAAIGVTLNIGVKINIIKKALKNFSGIQRRFTKVFSYKKIDFFDDYAHHPSEITALLKSIKEVFKKRKIISIFQPHRFSRVNQLKKEFSLSFKNSDEVVLCPVYSAGEKQKYSFNQKQFSNLILKNSNVQVINIKDEKDLYNFFKSNLYKDELVICMGAGSISSWIKNISLKL